MPPPLPPQVVERVVALTQTDPPGETTQWTGAAMAEVAGISVSSVQRIWRSHGLQPPVNENSQIQALDRAPPGLPLRRVGLEP